MVGTMLVFLLVKMAAKFIGMLPAGRLAMIAALASILLLMNTGLTFSTISALYGLKNLIFGSVAQKVATYAKVSVTIIE